ncbi:aquaporin-like protein [Aulographum hederae CBS 113979]|uniref:Aquaporin-like protein n=1 Tax=Aulographum hederae CBS 113979 TaxID=1176131 RepID=A0A6G1GSU5_9PEZI|nr:aquaporin-like protein [Aulographum hederae CBS 113979]
MNINRPADNMIALPFVKVRTSNPNRPIERRLRGFGWMPNAVRNHIIAMIGEFVGTFMFLFFAFTATQVANTSSGDAGDTGIPQGPNTSNLLYISLAFGFSLAVNAWVFFRISGGLFNPAVTLGMCLIGAVGWFRGALVLISQIVGAIAAAAVVSALFPGPLGVRTTLGPGTSIVRGLFIEMFLTAELVFTIFMLAAEKHKGTFLAPIGIGLSLFIAELAGVFFTGGSLNPARSFGPDVVLGQFNGYHWIYWVGPALGSLIAVIFYRLVKVLEYETANPGQDFNEREAEAFQDDRDPVTAEDVRRPVSGGEQSPARSNSHSAPYDSKSHVDVGSHSDPQEVRGPAAGNVAHRGYDGSHDSSTDRNRNGGAGYARRSGGSKRQSSSDAYAEAANAVYPQTHGHPPHGGSFNDGPDAEKGFMSSAGR